MKIGVDKREEECYIVYIVYIQYKELKGADVVDIIISNSNPSPIYEQIVNQIKGLIMTGRLQEGEALPSMRLLAKELRISVITTKRAYEELERDGFIVSVTGKGSFVAEKNLEFIREEQLKQVEEWMQKAVNAAKQCGMTTEQLKEMISILYGDDE